MSPPVNRIPSDEYLPEHADVVVIGAGIIGVAAAYHLRKKGHSVALIEKGHVGAEQSSRNWGWCRQQGRDPHEVPLARISLEMWGEIQAETDVGFRRNGVLWLTNDPNELEQWSRWANMAREHQVHSHVLDPADIRKMLPDGKETWIGGLHTPSDGRAEPSMAAPALAALAQRLGVSVHQNCAVRGMETGGGRVEAVVTEKGRIRTSAVLLAGGVWSSLFCRRHGIDLPQGMVRGTAFRTTPAAVVTEGGIGTSGYCIRRREDGGYTVALRGRGTVDLTPDSFRYARAFWPTLMQRKGGLKLRIGKPFVDGWRRNRKWSFDQPSPFEEERVHDPAPDDSLVQEALCNLRAGYPTLANIEVAESWCGSMDSTPDAVPVISAVDALPGFFLATGFSGHGFGIGPASGRLAADIVCGDAPIVDPHAYRYSRLFEGKPLAPAGAL